MRPFISVIIPSKNEEKLIQKCLSSIIKQASKYPSEIILVDSNSRDGTIKIAEKFPVRIIKINKYGKALARQIGAKKALGKILVFTEADCIVPINWFNQIISVYQKSPDIVGVNGVYLLNTKIWWLKLFSPHLLKLSEALFKLIFGHHSLRASNFSIKKIILERAGGFDIYRKELDDVDLCRRVNKYGCILFDPQLVVLTSDRRFKKRVINYLFEFVVNFVTLIILNRRSTILAYEDIR